MNTKVTIISSEILSNTFYKLGSSFNFTQANKVYKPTYIKDDTDALSKDWQVAGRGLENAINDFRREEQDRICECSR